MSVELSKNSKKKPHFINIIIINILIVYSDKFRKIKVQQWYILLNDEMLINNIYLDVDIYVNFCFYLLISLNYIFSVYKSFYEKNFLFFSWWFEAFVESLFFLDIWWWFIWNIKSMNTWLKSDSFNLFLIFLFLQSIK